MTKRLPCYQNKNKAKQGNPKQLAQLQKPRNAAKRRLAAHGGSLKQHHFL
jgi:hypothetical protein